jgi:putative transposase
MPEYRRTFLPGGTFFFTLVTNQRQPIFRESWTRLALREAFRQGMEKAGLFQVDAICLLPDHMHCIWTLPENDCDYSTRWKVIKACFSHQYLQQGGNPGRLSASKVQKGELGVWQRRFWEHTIRDLDDMNRHVDYIHYNPVKHGLVRSVKAWPWSSFHRYVKAGYYDPDWASEDQGLDLLNAGEVT